nr:DNA-binding protein [Salmonella sp. NCTC 7297]
MAALRSILQQAGRRQVVEHSRLTNKALGLAGASRNGTNRAITPEHYQQVLENAREKDAGLAATLELAKADGATLAGSGTVLSVIENVETGAGAWRNPADGSVWHQKEIARVKPLFRMLGQ